MSEHAPVVIVGAGPAGLTAGYELARQGIHSLIVEKADRVGGIARTETFNGYHFDIGGHRFFTKVAEIQQLWEAMLGDQFRVVPRLSRIYYRDRLFKYPLDAMDALSKLGPAEGLRILLDYVRAQLRPSPTEDNFEEWVTNRFGRRLYEAFFKTYTEKVWGIPCRQIAAEWAAQRIQGLSLTAAIVHALYGRAQAKSLIGQFHYPLRGPGTMWQRFHRSVEEQGGRVWLGAEALHLQREANRIVSVLIRQGSVTRRVNADHVISSMPLKELIGRMDPPPPSNVLQAACQLTYRSFILVGLIVKRADLFPDQWIYIHSPELKVGRVQNFKNWSPAMVPDAATTGLGMEYFCTEGDEVWSLSDAALVDLAGRELAAMKIVEAAEVTHGVVFRQPAAYPVYYCRYREALDEIRGFLATLSNLQTVGRNGMHRYNNQDHSMLTAMLAVRNLRGESHNLWAVNTEQTYHEARLATRAIER